MVPLLTVDKDVDNKALEVETAHKVTSHREREEELQDFDNFDKFRQAITSSFASTAQKVESCEICVSSNQIM